MREQIPEVKIIRILEDTEGNKSLNLNNKRIKCNGDAGISPIYANKRSETFDADLKSAFATDEPQ